MNNPNLQAELRAYRNANQAVTDKASDLDAQTEKKFGLKKGDIEKFENVESATFDGHYIMTDGSIVPCNELM